MLSNPKLVQLISITLASLFFACGSARSFDQATITINSGISYQTINGWEATAEMGEGEFPNEFGSWKNELLDQAVELGINRIRLQIKSGAENPTDYFQQYLNGQLNPNQYNQRRYEIINDNADPNSINPAGFRFTEMDYDVETTVLPLKQRLAAQGETLHINVNYVDFGGSAFEHKTSPAEYAEFVLATYQHLQTKYGIVPDSWEVILEPDTSTAAWSAQQLATCMVAAGARLQAAGYTPAFVAPSTTNAANAPAYFDAMVATAGALSHLKEFSYHRYAGGTDPVLQAIVSRAVGNNVQTSMLEWIGADYQTLHKDLSLGRNSAWQQFTLAYPTGDNGAQYFTINRSNPSAPVVQMGSRTKFLRQYFKFIRHGAVRIEATSNNSDADALAFINPDGKYAVVVKTNGAGSISLQGLPAGVYGLKYTTSNQYNVDLPDVTVDQGQMVNASIPDRGVITIYSKGAQSAPSGQAIIDQCSLEGTPAGGFVLTVAGRNFKEGASVTVGGVSPKKIKYKGGDPAAPGIFRRLVLKGRFCDGLPGPVVVTNPGGPPSAPLQCNSSCR